MSWKKKFTELNHKYNKENKFNLFVFYFYRPLGILLANSLLNTNVTPNQITFFRYFISSISLYLIYINELYTPYFNLGFFIFIFSEILDYVDGSLARLKNQSTNFGTIIDTVSDHFISGLFFFILVIKSDQFLLIYFLFIYLLISWSQVYTNTLMKLFKKSSINLEEINKKKELNELNEEYKNPTKNPRQIKIYIQKIVKFFNTISVNLNLIILVLFLLFGLLIEYLYFYFCYQILIILVNIILIIRNEYDFLKEINENK